MQQNFLEQLQQEALKQKKLHNTRLIPAFFDPITSYIGEHAPTVLVVAAVASSILLEIIKRLSM